MLFKPKYDLTFVCAKGKEHFAEPILAELEKKYNIQYLFPERNRDYWHYKVKGRVIWNEWANKFAWHISKKNWKSKKIFVRLHRYEIDTKYMKLINWNNINSLIFVNNNYEMEFKNKINNKINTITIPNAVDVDSFPFIKEQYGKSLVAYGFAFNKVKGYLSLIKMFNKLIEIDPDFRLTIMGTKTEDETHLTHLKEIKLLINELNLNNKINIVEKEKITSLIEDRKNVSDFLQQHDIILSYSETESFHYAFAEGMLVG